MHFRRSRSPVWVGLVLACMLPSAWSQTPLVPSPTTAIPVPLQQRSIGEWLMRIHQASQSRSYQGIFVVSSDSTLVSARIAHVSEGTQQLERVDSLTGPPRTTFRRNDHVVTFFEDAKVARIEKRDVLGVFPNLLRAPDSSIPEFYNARQLGQDRVAGFEADVVLLWPRDSLRYGYRLWSEKKSGLVVKVQTLDMRGRVLEQAAFSELQIDIPLRLDRLARKMARTSGYRTEKMESVQVDPEAEGWSLRVPVAGFNSMSCYKRPGAVGATLPGTLQWVFSDGLASVSLFLEPYDAERHVKEGLVVMGATQTLTQRVQEWWLTAVGEVPLPTLKAFAQSLERRAK